MGPGGYPWWLTPRKPHPRAAGDAQVRAIGGVVAAVAVLGYLSPKLMHKFREGAKEAGGLVKDFNEAKNGAAVKSK